MAYTFTVTNDSPQAMDFIRFIKNLDFVKVTKIKEAKKAVAKAADELEEDEYGIPIKYRDKIMAMSKESNRNIARRWNEDLIKMNERKAV